MNKKKILIVCIIIVLALLLFATSCSLLPYSASNGITGLPMGKLLESYESPNGEHIINIYLCGGGATVDFSIRGELFTKESAIRKNIYWNYHESDAKVNWMDDETVTINGHTLNIYNDI